MKRLMLALAFCLFASVASAGQTLIYGPYGQMGYYQSYPGNIAGYGQFGNTSFTTTRVGPNTFINVMPNYQPVYRPVYRPVYQRPWWSW